MTQNRLFPPAAEGRRGRMLLASDAGSLPYPPPSLGGVRDRDYATARLENLLEEDPCWSHCFPFVMQRRTAGIAMACTAVGLLICGAFMLSQIPATPGLSMQLAIIGGLLIAGGFWSAASAARDLLGSLTIDDVGVHVRPAPTGFSIRWNDLASWEVKDYASRPWTVPGLIFRTKISTNPLTIPCGLISNEDRERVRQLLRTRALKAERAWMVDALDD